MPDVIDKARTAIIQSTRRRVVAVRGRVNRFAERAAKAVIGDAPGWTGTAISNGYFDVEPNSSIGYDGWRGSPQTTGIGQEMVLTDGACGAVANEWIETAKEILKDVEVQPGDPSDPASHMQAEFIRRCFDELSKTSPQDAMENAIQCIIWGCSLEANGIAYDPNDQTPIYVQDGRHWVPSGGYDTGHYILTDLAARRPESVDRWLSNEDGTFAGVLQHSDYYGPGSSFSQPTIYADQCQLYTWRGTGDQWQGWGILRDAYLMWRIRAHMLQMMGIAGERFAVGIPVLTETIEASMRTDRKQASEDLATLKSMMAEMRSGAFSWADIPFGYDIKILESNLPGAQFLKDAFGDLGRQIMLAGKCQHLFVGTEKVGAQSSAETHTQGFRSTVAPLVEYILEVREKGVVKTLIDLNWEGVRAYPKLVVGSPSGNVKELIELRRGLTLRTVEDEREERRLLKSPELTEEEATALASKLSSATPKEALMVGQMQAGMAIIDKLVAKQITEPMALNMIMSWLGQDEETARGVLDGWKTIKALAAPDAAPPPKPDDDTDDADDDDPDNLNEDAIHRGCSCGALAFADEGAQPSVVPNPSPAERLRFLAEANFDAKTSRLGREEQIARLSSKLVRDSLKIADAYLTKNADLIEAGDMAALAKAPMPGKRTYMKTLVPSLQETRAVGHVEVKREMKRFEDDEDLAADVKDALADWTGRKPEMFAEVDSASLEWLSNPKEVTERINAVAGTTSDKLLAKLNDVINDTVQQQALTGAVDEKAVMTRLETILTPRQMATVVTKDVNGVYGVGRAEQARKEDAGVAVYTLNPEIGLNGPHTPCVECQATADDVDNPALVGSTSERNMIVPNPLCLSNLSPEGPFCWCTKIYLPTNSLEEAEGAMGI